MQVAAREVRPSPPRSTRMPLELNPSYALRGESRSPRAALHASERQLDPASQRSHVGLWGQAPIPRIGKATGGGSGASQAATTFRPDRVAGRSFP
jgi:hypothetical protein